LKEVDPVFVVIGLWALDPELREMQRQVLDGIVAGVSRAPGIVKGYWAEGTSDPPRSHTFIVFADRISTEAVAADVRGNIENQARAGVTNLTLDLAEVSATT
jgi:hypothetical protein